eukprot:7630592-Ditylum_brightwellii.AAC.1
MAKIRYTCWKWWHSPSSHGNGMSTATSHELYMDCASGKVVPAWKMDENKQCHMIQNGPFRSATQLPKNTLLKGIKNDKLNAEDYIEAQHNGRYCSNNYKKFWTHDIL